MQRIPGAEVTNRLIKLGNIISLQVCPYGGPYGTLSYGEKKKFVFIAPGVIFKRSVKEKHAIRKVWLRPCSKVFVSVFLFFRSV